MILRFATPIIFYTLAINLILNIDLWLVKKYFSQSAIPGYYYVAGILAKVPYYLFFGLNAAVLPYLSGALASGDHKVAHQTIRTACRILTIVIFPLAVLVTSYSHEIIVLFFSAEFFAGGDILRILFWGMALLAFHFLLSTILTADNKPKLPLIITLCILILSICFNLILIPKYGAIGAAIATTCSVFIGVLFSGTMVFKRFRTFIDLRSLGKIIFASLIIFFISLIVRANGLKIIFVCGVLLIIYLIFLIFLKELNVKKVINSIIDS